MQPALSLDYGSGARNGLAGAGWSLSGLPQITRCPSMRKNGQIAAPIQWNEGDTLCLDGEILVPDSDHYTYRKFHDDSSLLIRQRSSMTDAGYWQLYAKDGRIWTFGNTLDSRVLATKFLTAPQVMTWALAKVEDRAGNFMTVTWESPAGGGDIQPKRIDYTGFGGDPTTTKRWVIFNYETRDDVTSRMVAEQLFTYPERLKSLEMHVAGAAMDPVRSFTLQYTTSAVTERSLLAYIAECAGAAQTKLPVLGSVPLCRQQSFTYAPGTAVEAPNAYDATGFDAQGHLIQDVSHSGVEGFPPSLKLLDVDGDGRDDLLYMSDDAGETYHLRLSQGTVFGPAIETNIPAAYPLHIPLTDSDVSEPIVLDFNNDGHADVLVNQGSTSSPIAHVYLANNATGSWTLGGAGYEFQVLPQPQGTPNFENFQSADLNGDSRPDLVMEQGNDVYYAINLDGTSSMPVSLLPTNDTNYKDALTNYFMDLNNDGVTDLVTRQWTDPTCKGYKTGDYKCDCSKMRFGALDLRNWLYPSFGASPVNEATIGLNYCTSTIDHTVFYHHLFGDFNGDGIVDTLELYTPEDDNNPDLPTQLQLLLGGGGQSFRQQFGTQFTLPKNDTYQVVDVDGDGAMDLLVREGGNTPYKMYSFKGGKWVGTPMQVYETPPQLTAQYAAFTLGDVNGDGLTDFVAYNGTDSIFLYTRSTGAAHVDFLTNTSGDFTPATTVKYASYQIKPDEDRSDCKLPLACTTRAGFLVSEVDTDNGLLATNAVFHSFSGARSDTLGWGFLGFKTHKIKDGPSNALTTRTFDFTYNTAGATPFYPFLSLPKQVVTTLTYASNGQSVTRTSTTTNQYEVRGQGPFRANAVQTDAITAESNVGGPIAQSSTTRTFDDYGNETDEVVNLPLVNEQRHVATTYMNDYNHYLIGRPTYVSTTSAASNGASLTREIAYTYDALGMLAVEIDNPGAQNGASWDPLPTQDDGVQTLYTKTTRDAYGNATLVEKLDNLTSPTQRRATSYVYDTNENMFVIQTTDPANLVTQAVYEPALGVVAAQTDAANVLTTFQYDTFGRIRADHPAAGADRSVVYHAAGLGNGGTIDDHRSGQYQTTTTLDSLRRTIISTVTGRSDGKPVSVETAYDVFAHPVTVSRPHFAGVTPAKTTTIYDLAGRVTKVIGADGSQQTNVYAGLQVTSTNADGNVTQVTNDAVGRPVQSVQTVAPGHTTVTTLTYGPFDTLSSSTDPAGNIVNYRYDRLGRELWHQNGDSGTTAHNYNLFGEVTDEIRGAHVTWVFFGGHVRAIVNGGTDVAMRWDHDGRLVSRTAPDVQQTLTYDSVLPGKLSNTTITGGPTIAYTYDAFGNVKTKTWNGPRGVIGYSYTYDKYNRLLTTTYPKLPTGGKSLVVRNTYSGADIGGQLDQIDDVTTTTTKPLFKLASTDPSESFPIVDLANSVETTIGEDAAHPGWLKTITSKQGTTVLQNLRYQREGGGRVRERDDLQNGITETFFYDGLERLIDWSWSGAVGPRAVEYVYDDLGNLTGRMVTAGPGTSVTYGYGGASSGPHQVATYQYDDEGNELSGGGRSYTWSSFGRPNTITAASGTYQLTYDADLLRFSRTDPSGRKRYSYDGLFQEFTDAAGTHDVMTVSAGGRAVVEIEKLIANNAVKSTVTSALLTDALGSIDTIFTTAGKSISKYDPFGTRVSLADPFVRITAPPKDLTAGFTGADQDDDVDLVDLVGRVYDAGDQRFLSVDPPAPNPVDSQTYNPYTYVRNNPLNATDPTGLLEVDIGGIRWRTDGDPTSIYAMGFAPGSSYTFESDWYNRPYGIENAFVQGPDGGDGPGLPDVPHYQLKEPMQSDPEAVGGSAGKNLSPGTLQVDPGKFVPRAGSPDFLVLSFFIALHSMNLAGDTIFRPSPGSVSFAQLATLTEWAARNNGCGTCASAALFGAYAMNWAGYDSEIGIVMFNVPGVGELPHTAAVHRGDGKAVWLNGGLALSSTGFMAKMTGFANAHNATFEGPQFRPTSEIHDELMQNQKWLSAPAGCKGGDSRDSVGGKLANPWLYSNGMSLARSAMGF